VPRSGVTFPDVQAYLPRFRAHAVEAIVPVFAAGSIVEVFVVHGVHHRATIVVCALFWSLPFLLHRRNPVVPPFVVSVTLAALGLLAGEDTQKLSMPFLAALAASASFGYLAERRLRIAGWCTIVGAAAIVDYRSTNTTADFFWTSLIFTLAWFFGIALGNRTAQTRELRKRVASADRERAAAEERAAADERTRIARELHDVVAHSVSVMVVQASAVRRLLAPDQQREREALLSVERMGRDALAEMRRMLGVMRTEEDQPVALTPQPGLRHLAQLVAQVEKAGLPVTLRVEGSQTELPAGIDLSAYRIVQEGLTNALKHGKDAHAEVVVRYADGGVEVEVADDGLDEKGSGPEDGHGLVGMRERVALYGGTLVAGPRDGGGFVLRARLPVEVRS
jgi:signal transduction histidine kinase